MNVSEILCWIDKVPFRMGKEKYLKDICNWIDCIKGNIQCSLKALHTNAPVFNVWPQCSDAMYMAWIYVNNYLNFWTVLEASQQFMGSKGRQIGMWSWTCHKHKQSCIQTHTLHYCKTTTWDTCFIYSLLERYNTHRNYAFRLWHMLFKLSPKVMVPIPNNFVHGWRVWRSESVQV